MEVKTYSETLFYHVVNYELEAKFHYCFSREGKSFKFYIEETVWNVLR